MIAYEHGSDKKIYYRGHQRGARGHKVARKDHVRRPRPVGLF